MNSKRIGIGLTFLLVAGIVGLAAARIAYFAQTPYRPGTTESVVIEIRKGESQNEISRYLADHDAVSSERLFHILGRITRDWKRIKAGEYEVSASESPLSIFGTITSGISMAHPVTVREGENMYEIAADIASKGLASKERILALCKDPRFVADSGITGRVATLEGYLYPDTYSFNRSMTAEDMLRMMIKHFQGVWTPADDARARELHMTQHQIVILASMIEKETGAPEERPIISSVFYNRLRKGMRLQSDPTTIYGMWNRYQGKIHKTDLSEVNEYNTYMIPALPVGPIANPGKEALEAALHPSVTDYLYFVSHNDGTHEFTRTIEEHTKAVAKYQLDPKAREGKSWRDLSKRAAPAPAAQH